MRTALALMMLGLFAGCASRVAPPPYGQFSAPDVLFYEPAQIEGRAVKQLGEIEGVDCSPTWFRIARTENALNKLIEKARQKGGNGIASASCRDSGLGPILFCNNSVTCSGQAILVK